MQLSETEIASREVEIAASRETPPTVLFRNLKAAKFMEKRHEYCQKLTALAEKSGTLEKLLREFCPKLTE